MTTVARPARVVAAARLRGRLELPADKSIGHRALIVAGLSEGPATISMRSPGRDVRSTVSCLRALGVTIAEERDGEVVDYRLSGGLTRDARLDCGNSGTTMRLLAGTVAALPLRVALDGDASLRRRPMERLATILRAMGAHMTTTDGHAPLLIEGRPPLRAVTHRLPVASAQLIGAGSLAALAAAGTTRIEAPGATRDHTERLLGYAGVPIRRSGTITTLDGPARPGPVSFAVPGDLSAAAAWLVAAALHPDAELTLVGVGLNPSRLGLVSLLRRMGADIVATESTSAGPEPVGEITVRGGTPLRAVRVSPAEADDLIDELPLLAIAMAACDEESELRGAGELRLKESDRIAAVAAGLHAIGAEVTELRDGWRVRRGKPRGATIATHGDHRIAIAFAVAALAGISGDVMLDDPECTAVSYPGFWNDLAATAVT